jgi:hypothetical protein
MKIFEIARSRMVRTNPPRERDADASSEKAMPAEAAFPANENAGRPETANIKD